MSSTMNTCASASVDPGNNDGNGSSGYQHSSRVVLDYETTVAPTSKTVCIGIGGGVGPAAGVMLHKKIIEATVSDGTDQSHCEVHHISRPDVADRTSYLLGESNVSPAVGMARTMAALAESVIASGKITAVTGVPCNTFHAPRIWDEFVRILDDEGISNTVKLVHMLDETVNAINVMVPGARRVGLLSTTGTRQSRVYADLLEPQGFTVVQVEESLQHLVHDAIYNRSWGVKAVQPTTPEACAAFRMFASDLIQQGADAIILGCTEIPLALPMAELNGVPLIDPMAVLARAVVTRAGAVATALAPHSFTAPEIPQIEKVSSSASVVSVSSVNSNPPKWQQHAAAFVIQSHWRAHVASKAKDSPYASHEHYFRTVLGTSPESLSMSPDGITPEAFTPVGVAAGMLRVASCEILMT
eukprot:TRINITY_DN347_c0_g1_i3.p1 TRINITY_DN347_c0_g1~~TRINITY_DN347_c0_g1_i3.p1  ORF type:complete len:414 (+),score=87.14 TRINITY_DN347_c0_g1_i3:59-1300(+)